MNSVAIRCNCGVETSKYVFLIEYLRSIKYTDIKPTSFGRYVESKIDIKDIYDALHLKLCCRKEFVGMIRINDLMGFSQV
jgi:DNA-directed RNA polymerase subunit N (RpoN/RPB10)